MVLRFKWYKPSRNQNYNNQCNFFKASGATGVYASEVIPNDIFKIEYDFGVKFKTYQNNYTD